MKPAIDSLNHNNDSYLFRVEILVQGHNNGAALEHLLRILNEGGFSDYRIGSNIGYGRTIEEAVERQRTKRAAPPAAEVPQPAAVVSPDELDQRIRRYIESNRLIRLTVNKGRGTKINMPCRILNFDAGQQLLTVYHDDEKQVHSFKLHEVEDFSEQ
jgi:hypothetical protein